ncbi:MAG: hypothetical protein JW967_04250 [Dehalococcoidales bacterium]|nr:hypothetical protein [Dehalococcoidales bacterium]
MTQLEWATWTLAGSTILLFVVALVAAFFAWKAFKINREQLKSQQRSANVQLFSEMLKQLSEGETRYYRGLVWESVNNSMTIDDIKERINEARKASKLIIRSRLTGQKLADNDISHEAIIGFAIENTINSFDRVAYFLLDREKLRDDIVPPEWFWSMVNNLWCRLHDWIEYKQNRVEDSEHYQKGFAICFQRLAQISPR